MADEMALQASAETAVSQERANNHGQWKHQAIEILKDTTWCKNFSTDLLEELASIMVPFEAKDGHIFVNEGEEYTYIYILEEGVMVRTKFSVLEEEEAEQVVATLKRSKPSQIWNNLDSVGVVVDKITARGRLTGMMYSIYTKKKAYASMVASGDVKVWLVHHEDFRELVMNNASFSWQFMLSMSEEIRSGSKSINALIRRAKGHIGPGGAVHDIEGQNRDLRVLCYDSTSWVTENFKPAVDEYNEIHGEEEAGFKIIMEYTTDRLNKNSATFAAGFDAVCTFVNDTADGDVMQTISLLGVKMIAQRAAGFDRIDLKAARAYGVTVARVPAYSPHAVAEMAVTLLMSVNRKIHRATNRVRMGNFALDAGLMGMDIHGKTIGVMGTGKIGAILCKIMSGFEAKLICYDVRENEAVKALGGVYVTRDEIFAQSDVLFMMMPLLEDTYHTINQDTIQKLKRGMILINTSRGGLVDTEALLHGLRDGVISGVGLDVYENEGEYFFQDWSGRQLKDPYLAILLGLNNVILTAHQAFFTEEAVGQIVQTTIQNLVDFKKGRTGYKHPNNVIPPLHTEKK